MPWFPMVCSRVSPVVPRCPGWPSRRAARSAVPAPPRTPRGAARGRGPPPERPPAALRGTKASTNRPPGDGGPCGGPIPGAGGWWCNRWSTMFPWSNFWEVTTSVLSCSTLLNILMAIVWGIRWMRKHLQDKESVCNIASTNSNTVLSRDCKQIKGVQK